MMVEVKKTSSGWTCSAKVGGTQLSAAGFSTPGGALDRLLAAHGDPHPQLGGGPGPSDDEVVACIKRLGGSVMRTDMLRAMRWVSADTLGVALDRMVDRGAIVTSKPRGTKGRTPTIITLANP